MTRATITTAAIAATIGALTAALILVIARPATPTPDNRPTITLQITVTDARTGEPVPATVQIGGSVYSAGDTLRASVPAAPELVITAQAPGYERWSVGLRPHIRTSKTLTIPIRLTPTRPDL